MSLESSLTLIVAGVIMAVLVLSWGVLAGLRRLLSSVGSPGRRRPRHSISRARRLARRNSLPRAAGILVGHLRRAAKPLTEGIASMWAKTGRVIARTGGKALAEQNRVSRLAGNRIVRTAGKTARKAKRVAEVLREPDDDPAGQLETTERRIRDLQATRGR